MPFFPAEAGRFTGDIKNNIPKSAVTSPTRDSTPYIVTANTLEPRKNERRGNIFSIKLQRENIPPEAF